MVLAEEQVSIEVEPVKDMIDFMESARFRIIIDNPTDVIQQYTIKPSAPYVEWLIKTDPLTDFEVKAFPHDSREVFVDVKPLSVGVGRYTLRLQIRNALTQEIALRDIEVNVISLSNVPAVSISGDIPKTIDPKQPFTVRVWLENRNSLRLENVSVSLKSTSIRDSTIVTIGPINSGEDKKTVEFNIDLDDAVRPVKDTMRVVLTGTHDGKPYEIKSSSLDYEIISYQNIRADHAPSFRIFGKNDQITFVNDANQPYNGLVKTENPFYRALFTKATPAPQVVREEGVRYIAWDVTLAAQEPFAVSIVVNYLPLVVFLAIILALLVGYFTLRSPIMITKAVQDVTMNEGGIIRFKTVLHIQNRGKRQVDGIAVYDRIPDIADYVESAEPGMVQPAKVAHTKQGVIIKWMIDSLGRDEEVVIKYPIKARLSILGRFVLPLARVKFDSQGRTRRSYSNKIVIGSKKEDVKED